MNSFDQEYAFRTSAIIRAIRKKSGYTQHTVAGILGVSQSKMSKMEKAQLLPSLTQWNMFCEFAKISYSSIGTGTIDRPSPVRICSAQNEGEFKIPVRYARNRASKGRINSIFLSHINRCFGSGKDREFLESRGLDPDFFVDLDHQLSLQLNTDIVHSLIQAKYIDRSNMSPLTKAFADSKNHGKAGKILGMGRGLSEIVQSFVDHVSLYEGNFKYCLETLGEFLFEMSVVPHEHVSEIDGNEELGDFWCRYRKSIIPALLNGRLPMGKRLSMFEVECGHKGGDRCVYQIRLAM